MIVVSRMKDKWWCIHQIVKYPRPWWHNESWDNNKHEKTLKPWGHTIDFHDALIFPMTNPLISALELITCLINSLSQQITVNKKTIYPFENMRKHLVLNHLNKY